MKKDHTLSEKKFSWIAMAKRARSGKEGRDAVITELYCNQKLKNKIQSVVLKYGGTSVDVETIFSHSILQVVKTMIKKPTLDISTSLESYIAGIARFSYFNEIRKNKKHQTQEIEDYHVPPLTVTPESLLVNQNKKEIIKEILSQLHKNCKEVLMYWANGYSMTEISEMMGYKSVGMARKKKYNCFKALMTILEKNPGIKDILRP